MQPLLNIAIRAARRAGEVIVRGMNRVHRLDVRAKGQNDFVTEIDMQAEREIIETANCGNPCMKFVVPSSGSMIHTNSASPL
jgi:myo-inositol-1(or 4)-monophosphatase